MIVETKVDGNFLPGDSRKPRNFSMNNLEEHIPINLPTLSAFCNDHNVTPVRLLQILWGAVLKTYTGSNDVSFRFISPSHAESKDAWDERVCRFEMLQNISILDLLREEPQDWNQDENIGDIEGCDTLLLWKQKSAESSFLSQTHTTSNVSSIVRGSG